MKKIGKRLRERDRPRKCGHSTCKADLTCYHCRELNEKLINADGIREVLDVFEELPEYLKRMVPRLYKCLTKYRKEQSDVENAERK